MCSTSKMPVKSHDHTAYLPVQFKKKEGVRVEANPTRKLTGQRTRAPFKPLLSPDTNGSIITAISLFMIVTKNQRNVTNCHTIVLSTVLHVSSSLSHCWLTVGYTLTTLYD